MKISMLMFLALLVISGAYAKVLHQTCDGEQKTCCIPESISGVNAMWVKDATCPKGMIDDATCDIQFGCSPNEQPQPN